MHLARYAFDGDPARLEPAYRELAAGFPAGVVDLQLAIRRPDGLDVYDSCPTREQFEAFSTSEQFRAAVAAAGLPAPRVEGLGEVVHAVLPARVG